MGFFSGLLSAAAPIVGSYFGGPVGAAIGSAVGSGISSASAESGARQRNDARLVVSLVRCNSLALIVLISAILRLLISLICWKLRSNVIGKKRWLMNRENIILPKL